MYLLLLIFTWNAKIWAGTRYGCKLFFNNLALNQTTHHWHMAGGPLYQLLCHSFLGSRTTTKKGKGKIQKYWFTSFFIAVDDWIVVGQLYLQVGNPRRPESRLRQDKAKIDHVLPKLWEVKRQPLLPPSTCSYDTKSCSNINYLFQVAVKLQWPLHRRGWSYLQQYTAFPSCHKEIGKKESY